MISVFMKQTTISYRVDFNTFISTVGGGLGLFLGFSVVAVVLNCFEFIEGKMNHNSQTPSSKPTSAKMIAGQRQSSKIGSNNNGSQNALQVDMQVA